MAYTYGGAKNTENLILVAAASRVFFTFSYGEDKSNECASWQVSQIYFGAAPLIQYIHIHLQRCCVFFLYPFIFPFVFGQNN